MPDFDKLHALSQRLAELTAPNERETGLASWCIMVGQTWEQIVKMWNSDELP